MTRATRRVVVILVLVFFTFVSVHSVGAAKAHRKGPVAFRSRLLQIVNWTRHQHGLASVTLNRHLSVFDYRHSVDMARRGKLFHTTNLESLVRRYGATTWGENIGYAKTVSQINRLWMASPHHRPHLLDPNFHHVGIGIVRARGWLWVTLNLYG